MNIESSGGSNSSPNRSSSNFQAKQPLAAASSSPGIAASAGQYPPALFPNHINNSSNQQINQTLSNMSLQSGNQQPIGASSSSNNNNTPSSPPPVTPSSFQNSAVASSSGYTPMSPTAVNTNNIFNSISSNPGQVFPGAQTSSVRL